MIHNIVYCMVRFSFVEYRSTERLETYYSSFIKCTKGKKFSLKKSLAINLDIHPSDLETRMLFHSDYVIYFTGGMLEKATKLESENKIWTRDW